MRSWELYFYGEATKLTTRRSVAGVQHDRQLRAMQKTALRYEPVQFNSEQIACIARGFARAVVESAYVILACAIMAEHVRLVVERHRNRGEQIIGHFKARATQELLAEGLHPFAGLQGESRQVPPAWARRGWRVYLDNNDDIARAIQYVEQNPMKQGSARQSWDFMRKI